MLTHLFHQNYKNEAEAYKFEHHLVIICTKLCLTFKPFRYDFHVFSCMVQNKKKQSEAKLGQAQRSWGSVA